MSIAVSVVVRPSRLMLILVSALCLGIVLAAASVALEKIGALHPLLRFALAGSGMIAAFSGFFHIFLTRKTFRIDISGLGQIRLTQDIGEAAILLHGAGPAREEDGEVVQLMNGSTIWPQCLSLRLKAKGRPIRVIWVLPDSMAPDEFRALSVACRWIAAHNNRADFGEHPNQI